LTSTHVIFPRAFRADVPCALLLQNLILAQFLLRPSHGCLAPAPFGPSAIVPLDGADLSPIFSPELPRASQFCSASASSPTLFFYLPSINDCHDRTPVLLNPSLDDPHSPASSIPVHYCACPRSATRTRTRPPPLPALPNPHDSALVQPRGRPCCQGRNN
jgi:hypothetical protein